MILLHIEAARQGSAMGFGANAQNHKTCDVAKPFLYASSEKYGV
jgi:hypothetical protein